MTSRPSIRNSTTPRPLRASIRRLLPWAHPQEAVWATTGTTEIHQRPERPPPTCKEAPPRPKRNEWKSPDIRKAAQKCVAEIKVATNMEYPISEQARKV